MKKLLLISLLLCSFAGVVNAQIVTSTSLNVSSAVVEQEKLPAENILTAEIGLYNYDPGRGYETINSIAPKFSHYLPRPAGSGFVTGYGASIFLTTYTLSIKAHAFTGWRCYHSSNNNYTEFTIAPSLGYNSDRRAEFFAGLNVQLIEVSNKFVYGLSFEINDDDEALTFDKGIRLILGYKF